MFAMGEFVSEAFRWYAEFGDATPLSAEGQGHTDILDSFTSQPLDTGSGISEVKFFADCTRNHVSLNSFSRTLIIMFILYKRP